MNLSHDSLFNTVPSQDYFHFFNAEGEANSKKVVELLKYKNEDVAVAADISIKSIRYDEKMPAELKERIREWAIALNLVADFFKDTKKTMLWFNTYNPLLGGMKPRDMIRLGRFRKLLKFIQSALSENKR